jgi:hypothetical protein
LQDLSIKQLSSSHVHNSVLAHQQRFLIIELLGFRGRRIIASQGLGNRNGELPLLGLIKVWYLIVTLRRYPILTLCHLSPEDSRSRLGVAVAAFILSERKRIPT